MKPDYNLLREYMNQKLPADDQLEVEKLLQSNRDWFQAYADLRETEFLKRVGQKTSLISRDQLMQNVSKIKNKNYLRLFFRFLKDRTALSASDSTTLDFRGIAAVYSYRGVNRQGPVSIERQIGEDYIKIIMQPLSNEDEMQLSLSSKSNEKYFVDLFIDENLVESLTFNDQETSFDTVIKTNGMATLVLQNSDEEKFTIDIVTQSE